ncbi:hypothetical protein AVEN_252822-1 [Araneus ventricosus]|uniref:Transposase Tc1-like domain-containing protein n=1 Tax=Araneus ventricosus TaxID=182803 RepID=A0A4Y2CLS8_ARAVE|nr:hypothetical protein AVEN_252822-1 [Araneus ventricosus]
MVPNKSEDSFRMKENQNTNWIYSSRELNVHRSVIHRLWNHYQWEQNTSRRRGFGRRRITTTADGRYLLQCARHRRTLTTMQLASQLSAAAGRPIPRQTVSRRLYEGGLFARRPVVCVPLPPAQVRAQLDIRAVGPRTLYGWVSI